MPTGAKLASIVDVCARVCQCAESWGSVSAVQYNNIRIEYWKYRPGCALFPRRRDPIVVGKHVALSLRSDDGRWVLSPHSCGAPYKDLSSRVSTSAGIVRWGISRLLAWPSKLRQRTVLFQTEIG
jgi:hypothetical protein